MRFKLRTPFVSFEATSQQPSMDNAVVTGAAGQGLIGAGRDWKGYMANGP